MKKHFTSVDNFVTNQSQAYVLTIGNFDGVHLGHRHLLTKVTEVANEYSAQVVVMSFSPHPRKILQPNLNQFLLSSYEEKRNLLFSAGAEIYLELNFDRDFSTMDGKEFLEKYVFVSPQMKAIVLGYDFSFGSNKKSSAKLIQEFGKSRKIDVQVVNEYKEKNIIISSTLLRKYLQSGEVHEMNRYLARPFSLKGLVIKGDGRGKTIGFPTANMSLDEDLLLPQRGVYATQTYYKDLKYHSLTNVGLNPTFIDTQKMRIETHLLSFHKDIYGEEIRVEFLQQLRPEMKFSSANQLVEQIARDIQSAQQYFL